MDCLGHPVLYYPASAARYAKTVDRLFCSSEDDKILAEAQKLGHAPIKRPAELALPTSQHVGGILHALGEIKKQCELSDVLVLTLANNVTIKSEWIDDCVRMMEEDSDLTAVVPVYVDNDHHALRAKTVDENNRLQMYEKGITGKVSTNRQDLPKQMCLTTFMWTPTARKSKTIADVWAAR